MAAHLRRCAELERQIKAEAQQRSLYDPALRGLRKALREECEAALLADYALSQKHDVEALLWKVVFYRPIEEFRRRIKAAGGDFQDKTRQAYCAFLEEGELFYTSLAAKLQEKYGEAGYPQACQAVGLKLPGPGEPRPPALHDCRPSVARCLTCMGDLRRYYTASGTDAREPRDWSRSRQYYTLACLVLPSGGSAYNQLAVVATHEGNQLAAAFYYISALAAPSPFAVARENLSALLEQAKAACEALDKPDRKKVPRSGRSKEAMHADLHARFVHLLGLLFTRTSLDTFPRHLQEGLADLDDFLVRLRQQGKRLAAASASADCPPPLLLQLVSLAIYAVHSTSTASSAGSSDAMQQQQQQQQQGFAAAVQQQVVQTCALQLLLEVAQRLLAITTSTLISGGKQAEPDALGPLLLLPPLTVLLQWLASAAAGQVSAPADLLLPPAGTAEAAELTAARQRWWGAASMLLPAIHHWTAEQQQQAGPGGDSDWDAAQTPLSEDWQLRGFAPLAASQSQLNYAANTGGGGCSVNGASGSIFVVDNGTAVVVRGRKILSALHSLASHLGKATAAAAANGSTAGIAAAAGGERGGPLARSAAAAAAAALSSAKDLSLAEHLRLAVHAFLAAADATLPLPVRDRGPGKVWRPTKRQQHQHPADTTAAQPEQQQQQQQFDMPDELQQPSFVGLQAQPHVQQAVAKAAAAVQQQQQQLAVASPAAAAAAAGVEHVGKAAEDEEEVILFTPTGSKRLLTVAQGAGTAGPARTGAAPAALQLPPQAQVPSAQPAAAAAAALPAADVEMREADVELTAQAVAGSVLPPDDLLPPAAQPVQAQATAPAPAPLPQAPPPAAALPASFYSLFGGEQPQQAPIPSAQPVAVQQATAGMMPAPLCSLAAGASLPVGAPQPQQATALRSLLFGGTTAAPNTSPQQQQQQQQHSTLAVPPAPPSVAAPAVTGNSLLGALQVPLAPVPTAAWQSGSAAAPALAPPPPPTNSLLAALGQGLQQAPGQAQPAAGAAAEGSKWDWMTAAFQGSASVPQPRQPPAAVQQRAGGPAALPPGHVQQRSWTDNPFV